MTGVHSQSLGRANDRTLAALSAAMAMVRLERIGSSVDNTGRLTDGSEKRRGLSENETTVNTRLPILIPSVAFCQGRHHAVSRKNSRSFMQLVSRLQVTGKKSDHERPGGHMKACDRCTFPI
jgi:hypothetical protein